MDRLVVTISVERGGEEMISRSHSQVYKYPLNLGMVDYMLNATIEDYDDLQGAAPNTERGKCSTDTTGKPNN